MEKLKKICLASLCFGVVLLNSKVFALTGTITGKSVRLREKESTDSTPLTTMQKNEKVEIIGESEQWYRVKFEDKTGYVSKDYVEIVQEEVPQEPVIPEENNTENTNSETEPESTQNNTITETLIGKEFTLKKTATLRLKPSFSSIKLEGLNTETKVMVTNQLGNWIEVTNENKKGWICKSLVLLSNEISTPEEIITQPPEETTEKPTENPSETTPEEKPNVDSQQQTINQKGYINSDTVNVRDGASTDAKRLGFLDLNDEVEILAEEGDWYKINTKKYGECYIAKRLVSLTKVSSRGETTERTGTVTSETNEQLTSLLNNSNNYKTEIVDFAKQYLGYNYVSGGKKPETGFDCSGFTKYVYAKFGIELGSTAASQEGSGTAIQRTDLQPGDLLIFQNEGKTGIGHCGIYMGDNTFIHAANPKRGVVTDKLDGNSYYSQRFVSAQRF